jgi:hypothetical protein
LAGKNALFTADPTICSSSEYAPHSRGAPYSQVAV